VNRLLLPENAELLARLAWSRVILGFDFDGTLAPIVADRDGACMRERTRLLFAQVCDRYPCAVISGRSRSDVLARLGGAAVRHVIGNHGLEPGAALGEFEQEIAQARGPLEAKLATASGIDIEDKRYSLAIHYRKARRKNEARAAITDAVRSLPVPMRVVGGKMVVNIVPERAPNKGDALLRLRALEKANTAFYIGDDVTDEDVFTLSQPGRLFTVRVGESRTSAASYFLRDQREMDTLLARLVALRAEEPAR
jgi:trehalose 6-phosphate phosphatase